MNGPVTDHRAQAQPHLERFDGERAFPVFSFVEPDGFPANIRCVARWTGPAQVHLELPADLLAELAEGQRCALLWHLHDDVLFNLAMILVKGTFSREGGQALLVVDRRPVLSGLGPEDWVEALETFARNTRQYLADYGLTEPDPNWDLLEHLAQEAIDRYGDPRPPHA